jgi:hypothetical protein
VNTLIGATLAMIVGFGGPAGFLNLPPAGYVAADEAMHGANYAGQHARR